MSRAFRGFLRREQRKAHHKERVDKERKELEESFKLSVSLWHWDKLSDELVDYIIVYFTFNKSITPNQFNELLLEKLGDVING